MFKKFLIFIFGIALFASTNLFALIAIQDLKVGQKITSLSIHDQYGDIHNFEEYKDKKILIVYFPFNLVWCKSPFHRLDWEKMLIEFKENFEVFKKHNIIILPIFTERSIRDLVFMRYERYKLPFGLMLEDSNDQRESNGLFAFSKKWENFFSKTSAWAGQVPYIFGLDNNNFEFAILDKTILVKGNKRTEFKKNLTETITNLFNI